MDKRELIKDMRASVKGVAFMNKTQIARFLGRSRSYVPDLVNGLDRLGGNEPEEMKKRRADTYYIPDVAQRIMDRRA